MKSNREIRQEAKQVLSCGWFFRLLIAGMIFQAILGLVSGFLTSAFKQMSVITWFDLMFKKWETFQQGMEYTLPTVDAYLKMWGASVFQGFISYIFCAIVIFGYAGMLLKAVRNQNENWFNGSFSGFSRPLDVAWLMFVINLKVALWSMLLMVMGLVAAYRYRQAWYIKSEHPDWSASQCIAESKRLMVGHKWQAFMLDLTYLFMFVGAFGIMAVGKALPMMLAGGWLMPLLSMLIGLVGMVMVISTLLSMLVSRTVFYREVQSDDRGVAA